VFLASEKAVTRLDPALVELAAIRAAVSQAGYAAPEPLAPPVAGATNARGLPANFTRRLLTLLAVVFGAVLFLIVIGEWFGLFAQLTARVPFVVGAGLVALTG
jgi:hypothetical protein